MSKNVETKGNTVSLEKELAYYTEKCAEKYNGGKPIKRFPLVTNPEVGMRIDAIIERKREDGCIVKGWVVDESDVNDMIIIVVPSKIEDSICARNNKIRTDVAAVHPDADLPLYTGFEITTSLEFSKIKFVYAVNLKNMKQTLLRHRDFPRITKDLSFFGRLGRTIAISFERFRALVKEGRLSFKPSKWAEYADKIKTIKKETNLFNYEDWIIENEPKKEEYEAQREYKFEGEPLISIITPAFNTPPQFFDELMLSLIAQTYPNWELCLADGGSNEKTIECFRKWEKKEPRLRLNLLPENLGIAGNTNAAADLAHGEYIALLDHDDILPAEALFEMLKAAKDNDADFIYSDSDNFDEEKRHSPFFKPDFSPDFLRAINYICHFTMMSAELFNKAGRFRAGFDGAQDHDLFFRATEQAEKIVHVPKILYNWRAHNESVAQNPASKLYAIEAGVKSVQEHMDRIGMKGKAESAEGYIFSYRVRAEIIGKPLVSIIIPNKDSKKYLQQCLNSIIEKSTYDNYEILIVENNSETPEIFEYYKELEQNDKIRVVAYDKKGFNYSAINNYAVKHARGEQLLFLNNDTEVITPEWIEEMLMFSQRSDIGGVGAKLLFDDDTLQHSGVIIGIAGIAGHALSGTMAYFPGYFNNLALARNVSCVTGACMMIRKSVFEQVGGFDEEFVVALNDVDLCMKVCKAGYIFAQTPYAQLYHYESKTRGYEDTEEKVMRYHREIFRLIDRWESEMRRGDPFYNPNLTLAGMDYGLRQKAEIDYIDFYKKLKQKYIREGKL